MKETSRQEAIENGLPRYFTGNACKAGHVSERWTISGACIECHAEAKRVASDAIRRRREQEKTDA